MVLSTRNSFKKVTTQPGDNFPKIINLKGEKRTDGFSSNFSKYSIQELHDKLKEAVENENYEKAAKIRDEISKRS